EIDERLEVLRRLARKHGGSLQGAIDRRVKMKAELEELLHHDQALAEREAEVARLGAAALKLGRALSEQRRAAAEGFTSAVSAELSALGMARTALSVRFATLSEGGVLLAGENVRLGPNGLETAEL